MMHSICLDQLVFVNLRCPHRWRECKRDKAEALRHQLQLQSTFDKLFVGIPSRLACILLALNPNRNPKAFISWVCDSSMWSSDVIWQGRTRSTLAQMMVCCQTTPMQHDCIPGKMWGEITNPFQNFNGCTAEVYEWISNFILHFIIDVNTYPCWD